MLKFDFVVSTVGGDEVFHSSGKWGGLGEAAGDMFMIFHKVLLSFGTVSDIPANFGQAGVSKHREPWTDDEVLQALKLREAGYSYDVIGRQLGRTEFAVQKRLSRLKSQ